MTDYTKTTDFTSKDSLPSGDSGKIIRGAEFGTEFDNIQTAVNSKSNINNPSFTGNITVTGTVDGRDIAADGTKLDTIETSADVTDTANVTAAGAVMDSELTDITAVKALNQGVATTDSPTFAAVTSTGNVTVGGTVDGRDVATDGTKLDTVETNADVTDTTNVTAAGALMDSEVTNLAQVKAFDSADYATAAQGTTADNALPKTGGAMTGAITTNSTFDGRDVATDGTKLDGIEALADVTDTTNVTAAGALMDSELTSEASVKALNQGVATTDSPTFAGVTANGTVEFDGLSGTGAVTVTDILDQDDMSGNSATALATQQSIKAYVDSQVATSDTLAEVLANGNATGGTDIAFGDNDKAIFGAGSDLEILSNGTDGLIRNGNATGEIRMESDDRIIFADRGFNEVFAVFNDDDDVKLYHDGNQKLATTSTGIDVTGTATMDGLTVDGTGSVTQNSNAATALTSFTNSNAGALARASISFASDTASSVVGTVSSGWTVDALNANETFMYGSKGVSLFAPASQNVRILAGGSERLRIESGGDISFYEDTGTTAKLFWDASAESLGIGTSSPDAVLTLSTSSSSDVLKLKSSASTTPLKLLFEKSATEQGIIEYNRNGDLELYNTDPDGGVLISGSASADPDLYVSHGGNVGIGTTPSHPLHLLAADGTLALFSNGVDADLHIKTASAVTLLTPSTGTLAFGTSDTERMRIDSAGQLRLGNSTPTWDTTFSSLVTKGGFTGSQSSSYLYSGQNVYHNSGFKYSTTAAATLYEQSFGAHVFYNAASGTAGNAISWSEALRISSAGNVGINTSLPQTSLSIETSGTQNVVSPIVTGQTAGVTYGGLYTVRDGTGDQRGLALNVYTANVGLNEAIRIDSAGNLLVGTTDAAVGVDNTSTGHSIASQGYATHSRSSGIPLFLNRNSNDGTIADFRKDGTTVGSIGVKSSDLYIGTGDTGLAFYDYSTENAILPHNPATNLFTDASIDLGRGTSGSAYRFKDLYLSGSVKVPAASKGIEYSSTSFITPENNTSGAEISTAGTLSVKTGSSPTLAMTVDASGNLLVGTTDTNPANDASGTGVAIGNGGWVAAARSGDTAGMFNRLSSDGDIVTFHKDGTTVGIIGTASGYVSIGTSDTGILFNSGSDSIRPWDTSTNAGRDAAIDLGSSGNRFKDLYLSGQWVSNGSNNTVRASFQVSGTQYGYINVATTGTLYSTSSDYRLKENIVPLTNATERLKQLNPLRFNFIPDETNTVVDGFLAHEVQSVVPEAIHGTHNEVDDNGNPVYQGIDQSKLVPLLVATIQELEARIAALESN